MTLKMFGRRVAGFLCLSMMFMMMPPASATPTRYLDPVFTGEETIASNIAYGVGPKYQNQSPETLYLDVWQGQGDSATGRAAIVFAHGGGFSNGTRFGPSLVVVKSWARRGFVVVNMDYRQRLGKTIPELVVEALTGHSDTMSDAQHDMQAAIRWTRHNASTLRIDPDHIIAAGESAGAITAWHAGVNADDTGTSNELTESSSVSAVLSLWGAAIPAQIDAGAAPVIDMHNAGDSTVPEGFSNQACALMIAHGNVCEHVLWLSPGHTAWARAEEITETTSNFACRYAIPGCVPDPQEPYQVRT